MSVKPEMAFDVCWEVYRGAREVMESKRGIAALNMEMETKYEWRPDVRPGDRQNPLAPLVTVRG